MHDIRKVIAVAREQGHILEAGKGTGLTPIAPKTWFQPSTAHVIRNDGEELPYAIYTLRGKLVGRALRQGDARNFGFLSVISSEAEEIYLAAAQEQVNLFCYDSNDLEAGNGAVKLHISSGDITRWKDSENIWERVDRQPREMLLEPPFVQVKDQISGLYYEIHSKDCGGGCRCAVEARRVKNINERAIGE